MTQLGLAFDRQHTAITFVRSRPEAFRAGFAEWLKANWPVYEEFERRALRLANAGRRHYGARSIWEVMRFDSAVGELAGEWKLNDHWPPYVARLAMMMEPRLAGMFETRCSGVSGSLAA